MKLLSALGILAAAGAAHALDVQQDDARHEEGHASCCAPAQAEIPFSYLVNANPPVPGTLTGTATGRIVFEGEKRPKIEPLSIGEEQSKGCRDDGSPVDDSNRSLILSKDGGIRFAVVEIEVKDAKVKVPEKPIELDQLQCRYEPHVTLIPQGATVHYLNSDKVSHNVHTYATKNTPFNRTIGAGSKDEQKLEKSESIEVKCDIHPWMNAWMFVTDTPYTTVTDADGKFSIPELRPGTYKVSVWHEKLGKAKGEVTIAEDGSSAALEIKMSEKKKRRGRR